MKRDELEKLVGGKWTGRGELWLDKLGNEAHTCDCSMTVERDGLRYTWSHEGKPHQGSLLFDAEGATFQDTFHQSTPMRCTEIPGAWNLFAGMYTFSAGDGPPWGWRIQLSHRPTGELVLQMTVIKPSGEEGRAVRMIGSRV